jgi:hypothetical protein
MLQIVVFSAQIGVGTEPEADLKAQSTLRENY